MNDTPKKEPAPPRPAATVLLLRPSKRGDAASPLEVFMVVRHHQIDSFSGALVFPGGKLDPNERPEQALIRELREELGIEVKDSCLAPLTFASYAYEEFHLLMPLYVCRRWEGMVRPLEGQALKWVQARDLRNYPMPPADEPLIPALIDLLN